MNYTDSLRNIFIAITLLVIGGLSIYRAGIINLQSIISTGIILFPAMIIMGILGQKIGEIIDNPKNKTDADYKLAVLNALKKMDKSITLQELNEKLTKTVSEPDAPDTESEDDLDL